MTGEITPGQFASLLRAWMSSLAVGRLEIVGDSWTRQIWIEVGHVRAIVGDLEDEKIGNWLVKRGRLEELPMAMSLLQQPQGMRYGAFLVKQGLLTAESLETELQAQAIQILSRLLFAAGKFTFNEGERVASDSATLNMTTATLLLSAVRVLESLARLEPLMRTSAFLWGAQDAFSAYQRAMLSPRESEILARVTGATTVQDLRRQLTMPQDDFLRALGALVFAGFVVLREKPAEAQAPPPRVTPPLGAAPHPLLHRSGTQQPPVPQQPGHRPLAPAAAAPPKPASSQPGGIKQSAAKLAAMRLAAARAPKKNRPTVADAVSTPERQAKERTLVTKLSTRIRSMNQYDRLQLNPGATQGQVYMRYRELAEVFHPDRANEPHLRGLANELAEIFKCLEEAYETLGHEETRRAYDRREMMGWRPGMGSSWSGIPSDDEDEAGAPEPAQPAEPQEPSALKKAREMLAKGSIPGAITILEQAVRLNPDSRMLLELGQLELKVPVHAQRAVDHLRQAVSLNPRLTEGWLELARIWKLRGDTARQRECLMRVLSNDAGNREAVEALRSLK